MKIDFCLFDMLNDFTIACSDCLEKGKYITRFFWRDGDEWIDGAVRYTLLMQEKFWEMSIF